MKLKDWLFPEFTPWRIVDIYKDRNTYYCLQVRANKMTGQKYFKSITILEATYVEIRNLEIETINTLTAEE